MVDASCLGHPYCRKCEEVFIEFWNRSNLPTSLLSLEEFYPTLLHLQHCNCIISWSHFSESRINNDPGVQTILSEICNIRKALTKLQHYDTISVPLVYTQVRPRMVTSFVISIILIWSIYRLSNIEHLFFKYTGCDLGCLLLFSCRVDGCPMGFTTSWAELWANIWPTRIWKSFK